MKSDDKEMKTRTGLGNFGQVFAPRHPHIILAVRTRVTHCFDEGQDE